MIHLIFPSSPWMERFGVFGVSDPFLPAWLGRFWRFGRFRPTFGDLAGAVLAVLAFPTHFCRLGWGGFSSFGVSDPLLATWLGRF
jgi:hypothetical protein